MASGFSVTVESRPVSAQLGITGGLNGNWALIASVLLGCGTLCLLGTIGAPRRAAVHRLNGRSAASVVLIELTEIRVAPAVLAAVTPLVAIMLWSYNRFAALPVLASSVAAFCLVLLLPIVAVHIAGTVMACRVPIATAIRGTRPSEHPRRRRSGRSRPCRRAPDHGDLRTGRECGRHRQWQRRSRSPSGR